MTLTHERATFSLWGASYAMAKGVKLLRVGHEAGGKAIIYLDDTSAQATQALQEYWSDPPVGARSLVESRTVLLDMIHDARTAAKETKENTTDAATAN